MPGVAAVASAAGVVVPAGGAEPSVVPAAGGVVVPAGGVPALGGTPELPADGVEGDVAGVLEGVDVAEDGAEDTEGAGVPAVGSGISGHSSQPAHPRIPLNAQMATWKSSRPCCYCAGLLSSDPLHQASGTL